MPTDCHAHTSDSYCAEPAMRPELYAERIAEKGGSDKVVIADHTMAIYFPKEVAWAWKFICDSKVFDEHKDSGDKRLVEHFGKLDAFAKKGVVKGLETEMMHDGRFDFSPELRDRFDVLIGSVHWLPENKQSCGDSGLITRHWLAHTLKLIDSGIDIIGHPFRWLAFNTPRVDEGLIDLIVSHAKAAGVAVELNSHYKIETDAAMLKAVAKRGATLALSTDSHSPSEILDMSYHESVFKAAGLKRSDFKIFSR